MKTLRLTVFFRETKGSVITEFALVFPILLLIAFGMLQILFLVNSKTILQQAAFDAVRSAAVYSRGHLDIATANAEAIVKEQTAVLPIGEGIAKSAPEVKVVADDQVVRVKVAARVVLLPLIKQADMAVGGSGEVELAVTAMAKIEPFLGQ